MVAVVPVSPHGLALEPQTPLTAAKKAGRSCNVRPVSWETAALIDGSIRDPMAGVAIYTEDRWKRSCVNED